MKQLLIGLLLLTSVRFANAQDSIVNNSNGIRPLIGISIPELMHVGARYHIDDFQIGISIGSFPTDNESGITYSADIMWHLFGEKNMLHDKLWYAKAGITSMREETGFEINKWAYAHLRFGHEFALSNSIALQIDGGLMFLVMHQEIEKKPKTSWLDFDFEFPILPSIGITTAYSF